MRRLVVTVGLGTTFGLLCLFASRTAPPSTTFADAGSKASCIGIESSSIAPPGSSDEFPGGRAEISHFLKGLGGPPGATVNDAAKLHLGSHEACDAAG
jgi:hypothetical protein